MRDETSVESAMAVSGDCLIIAGTPELIVERTVIAALRATAAAEGKHPNDAYRTIYKAVAAALGITTEARDG